MTKGMNGRLRVNFATSNLHCLSILSYKLEKRVKVYSLSVSSFNLRSFCFRL